MKSFLITSLLILSSCGGGGGGSSNANGGDKGGPAPVTPAVPRVANEGGHVATMLGQSYLLTNDNYDTLLQGNSSVASKQIVTNGGYKVVITIK